MVSLRFPLLFSHPPKRPPKPNTNNAFSASAVACSVGAVAAISAGVALSRDANDSHLQSALNFLFSNFSFNSNGLFTPAWASLSLSGNASSVIESKTGMSFPSILRDSQRLLGIGLRKKSVLGLKNVEVYAFGVYADDGDVKRLLSEKYKMMSTSELKENKEFSNDVMESDISMTVRLQIVYGRLSIRSVRNAFEESVGSRLRKFGGSDNKDLLQRFTSQFKDEYKIPRGTIIDLSKESGYILRTTIDGKEVGSIQSKLLCRSILDLYIGDSPFDQHAKDDVELNVSSLLKD